MPFLSLDLINAVIDLVDDNTLLVLCCVSKAFYRSATLRLWSVIDGLAQLAWLAHPDYSNSMLRNILDFGLTGSFHPVRSIILDFQEFASYDLSQALAILHSLLQWETESNLFPRLGWIHYHAGDNNRRILSKLASKKYHIRLYNTLMNNIPKNCQVTYYGPNYLSGFAVHPGPVLLHIRSHPRSLERAKPEIEWWKPLRCWTGLESIDLKVSVPQELWEVLGSLPYLRRLNICSCQVDYSNPTIGWDVAPFAALEHLGIDQGSPSQASLRNFLHPDVLLHLKSLEVRFCHDIHTLSLGTVGPVDLPPYAVTCLEYIAEAALELEELELRSNQFDGSEVVSLLHKLLPRISKRLTLIGFAIERSCALALRKGLPAGSQLRAACIYDLVRYV